VSGVSVFFAIFQVVLKLIPELLALKARADERKEQLVIDERALFEAAKALLERAQKQAASETEQAKNIDEIMDREAEEHRK
jgi:hypothetical protein